MFCVGGHSGGSGSSPLGESGLSNYYLSTFEGKRGESTELVKRVVKNYNYVNILQNTNKCKQEITLIEI